MCTVNCNFALFFHFICPTSTSNGKLIAAGKHGNLFVLLPLIARLPNSLFFWIVVSSYPNNSFDLSPRNGRSGSRTSLPHFPSSVFVASGHFWLGGRYLWAQKCLCAIMILSFRASPISTSKTFATAVSALLRSFVCFFLLEGDASQDFSVFCQEVATGEHAYTYIHKLCRLKLDNISYWDHQGILENCDIYIRLFLLYTFCS